MARRVRHVSLTLLVGLALGLPALASPATAAPQQDLAAKEAEARRLQGRLDANVERASMLDEEFLESQAAFEDANHRIAAAEQALVMADQNTTRLRGLLAARAARLYMTAGNTDPLGIDAADARELGTRAKYAEAAADRDRTVLDDLKVAEEQLNAQRKDLEKERADAEERKRAADTARDEVQAANNEIQELLSSTRSDIRDLLQQIEQERAEAAERAARAARAAQAAQAAQQAPRSPNRSPNPSDIGVDPGDIPAPSGGASAAVAYARAQIGKPYRYAGVGPDSYDCSGLTMMAWRQGGVSMAHGARAQYAAFPKVPIAQLQPGDLVFFGSPIHHVGIYIGGGTMIEAPHTGAFVRYRSIHRRDLVQYGSRP
jgi:cell wall-associated NlpC family hydrolase